MRVARRPGRRCWCGSRSAGAVTITPPPAGCRTRPRQAASGRSGWTTRGGGDVVDVHPVARRATPPGRCVRWTIRRLSRSRWPALARPARNATGATRSTGTTALNAGFVTVWLSRCSGRRRRRRATPIRGPATRTASRSGSISTRPVWRGSASPSPKRSRRRRPSSHRHFHHLAGTPSTVRLCSCTGRMMRRSTRLWPTAPGSSSARTADGHAPERPAGLGAARLASAALGEVGHNPVTAGCGA